MLHYATVLSDIGVLAQVGTAVGVVAAVGLTVTMIGVCVAVTCCLQIFLQLFARCRPWLYGDRYKSTFGNKNIFVSRQEPVHQIRNNLTNVTLPDLEVESIIIRSCRQAVTLTMSTNNVDY